MKRKNSDKCVDGKRKKVKVGERVENGGE